MDNVTQGKNELGEFFFLPLNKSLYSRDAIMKTCYAFTDDFFIHAVKTEHDNVGIFIYKKNGNVLAMSTVAKQFLFSLHENQMRQIVHDETSALHEEIVKKAFAPAAKFIDCREQTNTQDILKSAL